MSYEYTGMGGVAEAEELLSQSHSAFSTGNYEESLRLAQQAEQENPDAQTRYRMAQVFPMVRLGQCLQAEGIYNQYQEQIANDQYASSYQSAVQGCLKPMPDFSTVPIVDQPGAVADIFNSFLTANANIGQEAANAAIQSAAAAATDAARGGIQAVSSVRARAEQLLRQGAPYVLGGTIALLSVGLLVWIGFTMYFLSPAYKNRLKKANQAGVR